MTSRYQQLREAISVLAAPANEQDAHLRRQGFTEAFGNDELALEFEDVFISAPHLYRDGILTQQQFDAASAVDRLLDQWSGEDHSDFWERASLWSDPRWEEVRQAARAARSALS